MKKFIIKEWQDQKYKKILSLTEAQKFDEAFSTKVNENFSHARTLKLYTEAFKNGFSKFPVSKYLKAKGSVFPEADMPDFWNYPINWVGEQFSSKKGLSDKVLSPFKSHPPKNIEEAMKHLLWKGMTNIYSDDFPALGDWRSAWYSQIHGELESIYKMHGEKYPKKDFENAVRPIIEKGVSGYPATMKKEVLDGIRDVKNSKDPERAAAWVYVNFFKRPKKGYTEGFGLNIKKFIEDIKELFAKKEINTKTDKHGWQELLKK